jgi:hypothetical protein
MRWEKEQQKCMRVHTFIHIMVAGYVHGLVCLKVCWNWFQEEQRRLVEDLMKRQQRLRGDEGEVPQVSLRLSPGCGSVLAAAQSWLQLSPGCRSVLAAAESRSQSWYLEHSENWVAYIRSAFWKQKYFLPHTLKNALAYALHMYNAGVVPT